MTDTRIQFRDGSTFALDDFAAEGVVHIEDLGGSLFIGVSARDAYYHFEVVPTHDKFGRSVCCQLIDREETS